MNQKQVVVPFLKNVQAVAEPIPAGNVPDNGVVTLTQCNAAYDPEYDLEMDCMMSYVYGIDNGFALQSWAEHKHTYHDETVCGLMIAINRDSGEYVEKYAGDRGLMDVQTRADGSYRLHSMMGDRPIYYMVPTKAYVEYKWKAVQHFLDTGLVKLIAFEEPEFWNEAGYSDGFKEAYQVEYGTPWQPPETSATVRYRTQRLKALMFVRAMDVLSRRIKEHYPEVQVILATHCVDDYCAHGIATALSFYGQLPCVDGFIGQTWSDGVVRPLPCAGKELSFSEGTALFQYRSYRPFIKPQQALYLLQDPSSDNPSVTNEWRQENWRKTVVASMLQPHTVLSQFTVWPQRAFQAAQPDYRTIQLNIYKMYQEMDRLVGAIYTGTTGIAIGLSDTAGWCIGKENVHTGRNLAAIFGLSLPLICKGMPVDTLCLDTLQDTQPLKDVNLLLLTYDGMKPLSSDANEAIARFVQEGGQVLYIGGDDAFTHMPDAWWQQQNTTPLGDLLNRLSLSSVRMTRGVASDVPPCIEDQPFSAACGLSAEYAASAFSFTGDGITPLMTVGDQIVGFEAACGKGGITVLGLPVAYISAHAEVTDGYLSLCRNSLAKVGIDFQPCQTMAAMRGRYVACCALEEDLELDSEKTLLDLFDPTLSCLQGGRIPAHTTGFYYDVTDLLSKEIPCLLFTGGVEVEDREEQPDRTVFTITHPSDSRSVSRVFCAGRHPTSVEAITKSGRKAAVSTAYDSRTDTLRLDLDCDDVADPACITIYW